jgi:MoaA/NifB/PqqE/SkfB family radical SAM enzyme
MKTMALSAAQKYLTKIPQYTRNARHLRAVLQHGTPRKWANLAMVEYERFTRKVTVKSRPYILFLDPCNYCDLRCPLCPTGMNALGRPQKMLSFECFKKYFDPHAPYLFECILHNWGESLLNKEIFSMISYAQSKNVGTNLSTNFVNTKDEDLDKLLDSGLEYLTISLDGTTQQSYSTYRVRGDFARVRQNLETFLNRRAARKLTVPVVEWQYIVMKHNQSEVEEAERLSRQIGVDVMRFIPVGLPFEAENRAALADDWFPTGVAGRVEINDGQQIFGQDGRPGGCYYLYRSMTVNPDGGVSPCCIVYKDERDFAHLESTDAIDVGAIWNNEKFRSGRSLFSAEEVANRKRTICDSCTLFAWHPTKAQPTTTADAPSLVR